MAQLQVDYGRSCSQLFTKVAQQIIIAEGSWVSLLSDVESVDLKDRRPGLPSWAPDWSVELLIIKPNPRHYGHKLKTEKGNFLHEYYSLTNLTDVSPVFACFGFRTEELVTTYPKSSWPTCAKSISDMNIGFYTYIHHPTNPEDDALANHIIKSCESLIEDWQKLLGNAVSPNLTPSFISPRFAPPEGCYISIGVLGHLALFDTTSSAPHFPNNAAQSIMAHLIIAELHDHGPSDYDGMSLAVFNKRHVAMVPKSTRPRDLLCRFEGVIDLYVLRPAPEKRNLYVTEEVNSAFDSFVRSKTPGSKERSMRDNVGEEVEPEIQHWSFGVDNFYFIGQAIVEPSSLWNDYVANLTGNTIIYRQKNEKASDYVNRYLMSGYRLVALY